MTSSQESPKISVIIPMYNCEKYIGECLSSLKDQTLESFEAICVDDGSSDNTIACGKASVEGDERFIFEALPENKGQSVARNLALDKARGEYIILLDADDCLVAEALEKLYDRATKQQLDELCFSARSFYESYEVYQIVIEDYRNRDSFEDVATGKELFTFFQERGQFFPQGAFRMVKRSLIEDNHIRFYEGVIHEDLLYTFNVLVSSNRSSFLNEELYLRRLRAGSTMTEHKGSLRSVRGHFACIFEMKKWMFDHAESLDVEFIDAMVNCIDGFVTILINDWTYGITEDERQEFMADISKQERIILYNDIIFRSNALVSNSNFFLDSATFKVGNVFMFAPRWLKARVLDINGYFKGKSEVENQ